MPVSLGPRPLPQVVLSRDLGCNATREAESLGWVHVSYGAFVRPLAGASRWAEAEHLARARVVAAAHRLSAQPVFSHESAALVHGLWQLQAPTEVHVFQQRRPRRQTPGLRRHHTGNLSAGDITEVCGLRVTA